MQAALERDGYALVSAAATSCEITVLIAAMESAQMARAERGGRLFGGRNLLGISAIRSFASSPSVTMLLTPLLGGGFQAVRGLFFDKTEGANWPVAWHQDLLLAVAEQRAIPGWGNWSIKRGVPHVQPPADVLAQMMTLRLHLDDCRPDNGPLRVMPGSHAVGLLGRDAMTAMTGGREGEVVLAKTGDALLMRPLLLHASSPARVPSHRRVLHLEFAPAELLPAGLAWAAA